MYKFLSKGQNKTVLLHLYSGELDKIVGEREAEATRWGGLRDYNREVRDFREFKEFSDRLPRFPKLPKLFKLLTFSQRTRTGAAGLSRAEGGDYNRRLFGFE